MWNIAVREPPDLQVLVVAYSGVLGLELVDVLREVEAERPEALDQPLEVLLAQRRQLARRSGRFRRGLRLLLGRRLLDGALACAPRGAVAPRGVVQSRRAPAAAPLPRPPLIHQERLTSSVLKELIMVAIQPNSMFRIYTPPLREITPVIFFRPRRPAEVHILWKCGP